MLYIKLENGHPVEAKSRAEIDFKNDKMAYDHDAKQVGLNGWISRHDIGTLQIANVIATALTEKLGKTFLGIDQGQGHYPRFDVIEAPVIGDAVSRAFNGDYYPAGIITKITPTWQITTSTGVKFRRKRETDSWKQVGGSFSMVSGHIDERNPSF